MYYGPQCRQTGEAFLKESSFHYRLNKCSVSLHVVNTRTFGGENYCFWEPAPTSPAHGLSVDTRVTQASGWQCDSAVVEMLQTVYRQCVNYFCEICECRAMAAAGSRPGFSPRPVHVGFAVDKVALGHVSIRVLRFPVSLSFNQYSRRNHSSITYAVHPTRVLRPFVLRLFA